MTAALACLLLAHAAAPERSERYPQFPPADVCWAGYESRCESDPEAAKAWRYAWQLQSDHDALYYQPHVYRMIVVPCREQWLLDLIGEPAFRAGVLPGRE